MSNLQDIRQRHIQLMTLTADILSHILKNVSMEQATSLRDGPEGWTILEILCHLRDFDIIFRERAEQMLADDHPTLPAFDHEAMAIEKSYNEQDYAYAFDAFIASRKETKSFFEQLSDQDWERTGIHPERGEFSMTDAVIQVGHHDSDHLEQITRLLEREIPGSGGLPSEDENDNLI